MAKSEHMGKCADCVWWRDPFGHSQPRTGVCEGNRLHVYPEMTMVSLEAGKRGKSAMDFVVSEHFGCSFWESVQ